MIGQMCDMDGNRSNQPPGAQAMTGNNPSKHPFVVILNAAQARSIYLLRSTASASPEMHSVAGKSTIVAELYRVSPKTIRDIWNRKTWTQVTRQLWTPEEATQYAREHMTPEERAALGESA
eukprot:CAMPEP_0113697684 /NCGR_PEP_ID=MMETSP0038_2-20120614/22272_1 /TAXON_ID=2898 /ORGANISM="Cryptomonas paramecium" /LENGTH=120 /DNA_ID=CAMNT_0000620725 /DNA_START=115 /DNA_END=474 /DNA_ORIENTATION=+ /assembly_acc=CAM_ASM_000170